MHARRAASKPRGAGFVFRLADDVERRCRAILEHGQQCAAAAVVPDDVGLDGESIAHMCDVLDVNGGSVDRLDGQIVERGRRPRPGCSADVVLVGADFHAARRQDDVLVVDRVDDVLRRNVLGEERVGVQIHHDLPRLTAVGQREAGALHGGELGADEVVAVIVDGLLAHGVARKAELQNRNAGAL